MAIDKNKTRELIGSIREFGESLLGGLPQEVKDTVLSGVFGPAFAELERLVEESRPPRIFLVGRSGHGKSSLVNALAGRLVAPVDDVRPCTVESNAYEIVFKENYSSWSIVDTRGIFETLGSEDDDTDRTAALINDLAAFAPDILIHVASATEMRNLKEDLRILDLIIERASLKSGARIPAMTVLTKVDVIGNPREWPPESYPSKAGVIRRSIEYMTREVLRLPAKPIDRNVPIRGAELSDDYMIAVVPVCAREGDLWNIDVLYNFIGERLPEEARLHFYQALKRRTKLRSISSSIIRRFSSIAALVGLTPIPIADIFVLTPLQLLMIAVICGLSCRELSMKTVTEYLAAMGINIGYAVTLRTIATELVKLVPVAGSVISATIAASGTYMLGKSAEAYFFAEEVIKPAMFKKDWKAVQNNVLQLENSESAFPDDSRSYRFPGV